MKQNIPKTRFSTDLSGSAKEIKLRLYNITQRKKKAPAVLVCLTAVLVLLCCGLVSCHMEIPPAQSPAPPEPSAQTTKPVDASPAPVPEEDVLSAVLSSISTDTVFYCDAGGPAYYAPSTLEEFLPLYRFGNSFLSINSIVFKYLPEQQELLQQKLLSIDPTAYEMIDGENLPNNKGKGTFYALLEFKGDSGEAASIIILPLSEENAPTKALICVKDYRSNSGTKYYLGPYDETFYSSLADISETCRVSTSEDETTVRIYEAGDEEGRVVPRWVSSRLVNLIDGATVVESATEGTTPEEEGCTVRVVIGGDEYWINTDRGIVVRGGKAYQLPENKHTILIPYLMWGVGGGD